MIFGILLYLAFAIWIFSDAKRRKNNPGTTLIGIILLGLITIPLYFAQRNLKSGETRKGGKVWNFIKFFVPLFALVMIVFVFPESPNIARSISVLLGMSIVLLAIGWIFRKPGLIEQGPTGALAETKQ
ncbi:MAG: hypothetical protein NTV54_04180 [Ignavibacteriales bacterium]|nr:hypothetical protein [Ignavibacteriales bacterium]